MAYIVTKPQFAKLIKENPNQQFVFSMFSGENPTDFDYYVMNNGGDDFGATSVNVMLDVNDYIDGKYTFEQFNYDWHLKCDYDETDKFVILEKDDIVSMIDLLKEAISDDF